MSLRKCKIEGGSGYSLFHKWIIKNGEAHAIVEHVSGKVNVFHFTRISFVNDLWVTDGIAKSTSNSYVQMTFNVPVECINVTAEVVRWDDEESENSYEVNIKEVTVDHCEYELLLDHCDDLKIDQLAIKQHLESKEVM